jgi:hypothetical protein
MYAQRREQNLQKEVARFEKMESEEAHLDAVLRTKID